MCQRQPSDDTAIASRLRPTPPMHATRLFLRFLVYTDNLVIRCNKVLTLIYVSLVSLLILATALIYFFHLLPLLRVALPPPFYILHITVSLYLILSVTINYIRCVLTPAGTPSTDTEASATKPFEQVEDTRTRSETWRWCIPCRAAKPPRAHHCSTCTKCISRMCHHCPAVGRCVGRDNYGFFFRFVVCAWVGALVAVMSAAWVIKRGRKEDAVLFYVGVGGGAVAVGVGVLAGWHCYLVMTGQTTVEWLENRQGGFGWSGPFDRGVRANVREAFGEWPTWMALLLPVGRKVGEG